MKSNCKDCKHFTEEEENYGEDCDGCSNKEDESCYCHINPPCGVCENNKFEAK